MFGPEAGAMLQKMSVPELVKIAQNPTGADPNIQYAALSEIERRKQMKPASQAPVNEPTVIQRMAMEAMTPQQQAPTPGDPVAQGVAALMAQQQQGRPPQRMRAGGRIAADMSGIMETLSPYFDTTAMTPEEARGMVSQFYGNNSYLDDLLPGMKEDEERARTSRNRDLWMALAEAGFGMASTGSIGEGALRGMDQAQEVLSGYDEDLDGVRDRRERVGIARGQREDQLSGAGLEALMESQRLARGAREELISTSAGIAETGAQIESANARDNSMLERLADMLYQENQEEVVWERYSAPGTPEGFGMRQRHYSRADALRDAMTMSSGGSGGRPPDDASELTRLATQLANPMLTRDPAARSELVRLYNSVAERARSNGMDVPNWDSAAQAAQSGGGGPAAYDPASAQEYRASRFVPQADRPYYMDENGRIIR